MFRFKLGPFHVQVATRNEDHKIQRLEQIVIGHNKEISSLGKVVEMLVDHHDHVVSAIDALNGNVSELDSQLHPTTAALELELPE